MKKPKNTETNRAATDRFYNDLADDMVRNYANGNISDVLKVFNEHRSPEEVAYLSAIVIKKMSPAGRNFFIRVLRNNLP